MKPDQIPNTVGVLVDANRLQDWILDAKAGESICYFVGELARHAQCEDDHHVVAVAAVAFRMQEVGKVCLTQRRIGEFNFAYYATKRGERIPEHSDTEHRLVPA